ncbi:hypothetical protein, partial [Streptomyces albidoflavus]|uniref:hypothetical protein n=1 Tax=Streptomyces albidoflavus TaxID=1886 RepID=UPI001C3E924E
MPHADRREVQQRLQRPAVRRDPGGRARDERRFYRSHAARGRPPRGPARWCRLDHLPPSRRRRPP